LILAVGLFVLFATCTTATTPSRHEAVMQAQWFVDLLAAVALVAAGSRTVSRLRE
jgi:hypothetical protein